MESETPQTTQEINDSNKRTIDGELKSVAQTTENNTPEKSEVLGLEPEQEDKQKEKAPNDPVSNVESTPQSEDAHSRRKGRPGGRATSVFRGVSWSTRDRKWRADIRIKRRLKFLGFFATEEDAAKAYDKAALSMLPFEISSQRINFQQSIDPTMQEQIRRNQTEMYTLPTALPKRPMDASFSLSGSWTGARDFPPYSQNFYSRFSDVDKLKIATEGAFTREWNSASPPKMAVPVFRSSSSQSQDNPLLNVGRSSMLHHLLSQPMARQAQWRQDSFVPNTLSPTHNVVDFLKNTLQGFGSSMTMDIDVEIARLYSLRQQRMQAMLHQAMASPNGQQAFGYRTPSFSSSDNSAVSEAAMAMIQVSKKARVDSDQRLLSSARRLGSIRDTENTTTSDDFITQL